MTITDLIQKLQQLKIEQGDDSVRIVDESEGNFGYYKVLFNRNVNQNTNMSSGRPGEFQQ